VQRDEREDGYFAVVVEGSIHFAVLHTAVGCSSEEDHCSPVGGTGHKEGVGMAADWDRSYKAVVQDCRGEPRHWMTCSP